MPELNGEQVAVYESSLFAMINRLDRCILYIVCLPAEGEVVRQEFYYDKKCAYTCFISNRDY